MARWAAQGTSAEEAMLVAWKARWKEGSKPAVAQLADDDPTFVDKTLRKHARLTKAESSLLVQARTGVIGLREFLFRRKVPGFNTPYCECGTGKETVELLVVWCPTPPEPLETRAAAMSALTCRSRSTISGVINFVYVSRTWST